MKFATHSFVLAAVLTCSGAAIAQGGLRINEIYASHSGTDDQEFIELVGPGGLSLDGHMVLIVEGDEGTTVGVLDRAWDLTGLSMPADGYFVLGDDAVPNLDFSIGVSNAIENGSDTFYLVSTTDVAAIQALLGTVVENGLNTTVLGGMSTVVDLVALIDGGANDVVYDGAPVYGPDGTFLPAGIYRGMDAPNNFCPDGFLDFDAAANLDETRTPGGQNVNCDSLIDAYCTAQVNSQGCTPLLATFGAPSESAGSGFDIDVSELRSQSWAILIYSTTGAAAVPFSGGTICIDAAGLTRTAAQFSRGPIGTPCNGTASFDFNAYIATGTDPLLVAGQDVFAQYWSRDDQATPASNLTDAVAFNIGL